ncbi:uncharacterized protein CLUP02_09232 [Colletotrichum lupini]|uniref:Zn(2)-C6 fungal-type domain-containing protein n=1 Tax=Colletotrichum lupini TaxID=145971 RepID=A0A9Q8WHR3_9PEZI|nr:uncharacterized protein CLUP02_09232 [Colletotrichum lupini]UQC83736.1 hypothetical protein CLUP02_09232 [Colletotrichum lupini]
MAPNLPVGGSSLRASCEACRVKKIKCTGERPICSKCRTSDRECYYSPHKPMGRPTSRRVRPQSSQPIRRERILPRRNASTRLLSPVHTDAASDSGSSNTREIDALLGSTSPRISSPLNPETFVIHPDLIDLENNQGYDFSIVSTTTYYNYTFADDLFDESRPSQDLVSEGLAAFPPLASDNQQTTDNCACLSVLYLLLEHLRVKEHLVAPEDFALLRNTFEPALQVLNCQRCPRRYFSIIQNAALLGVLCLCLIESYKRMLASISTEETRATEAGEKKRLGIHGALPGSSAYGESSSTSAPSLFSVEISPSEWGKIMRNIVSVNGDGITRRLHLTAHLAISRSNIWSYRHFGIWSNVGFGAR